ncbi:MAG TPA: hypothetical protein VFR20_11280 [Burkholderiaceae bacterium]|nr:hypothetical protein [Burkholderiaceae bacterium]
MTPPDTRLTPEEHAALISEIGPLPLRGMAWPTWVKVVVWIALILIGAQIIRVAGSPEGRQFSPLHAGFVILVFLALVVAARFMLFSETRITADGIEQSWFTLRRIAWTDIQFARFVSLPTSKRLVCFTAGRRPVVFQAGTPELRNAFVRIAAAYRRRLEEVRRHA